MRRDFRHKVLSVLWILATPDCFRSVALKFGFTPGELHRYYTMIIKALCVLGETYITWPDADERMVIKQNFQAISGFPGSVICAILYYFHFYFDLSHGAPFLDICISFCQELLV